MEENNSLTRGDRIREIRLERKMTLQEFGNYIGKKSFGTNINKSTVSRWESNKSCPRKKCIKEIAELGGVSVEYINDGNAIFNKSDIFLGNYSNLTKEEEQRWQEVLLDNMTQQYTDIYILDLKLKKEIKKLLDAQNESSGDNPFSDLGIDSKEVILTMLKLLKEINFTNWLDTPTIQDHNGKMLADSVNARKKVKMGSASIHNNSQNAIAANLNDVLCSMINLVNNKEPKMERAMKEEVSKKLENFFNATSNKKLLKHD